MPNRMCDILNYGCVLLLGDTTHEEEQAMKTESHRIIEDFSFTPANGGSEAEALSQASQFFDSIENLSWHTWQLFVAEALKVEGSLTDIRTALASPFHPEKKRMIRLHYKVEHKEIPKGPKASSIHLFKRHKKKVEDIVDRGDECPLPLSVIPNYMGINLCAVDSVTWEEQADGQLVSFTISFIPS